MWPIHFFHALWKCGTILALILAGRELGGRKVAIWSGLFYCVYSICFMSKDFHTPSAESFSLLPASLCAAFFFMGVNQNKKHFFFLAGMMIGLATFCKAPMGVLLVAAAITLFFRTKEWFKDSIVLGLGFFTIIILPAMLVMPFGEGFVLMWQKIHETQSTYIQSHQGLSFLYWIMKFFIRTALILFCCLGMTGFAMYGLQPLFRITKTHRSYWQTIFFLFIWLLLIWFTVAIGKRVFYHYYVFLLPPLSLLSASGLVLFDKRLIAAQAMISEKLHRISALRFLRRHLVFFMVLPASIFFFDGAFNFSTLPKNYDAAIAYIEMRTKQSDRIYVWGNIPQIYFYSQRLPSTVYFWSDILAGTSPGSPAMEYVRATKNSLNVTEMLQKDFKPKLVEGKKPNAYSYNDLSRIGESELFTHEELLERIDHYYWQKVFADFLTNPPELFIDSSPANIRGFGYFPIEKYELLKRFVWDNYKIEIVVDGLVFYRLKKKGAE